ncbi:hypothetical protein QBC45DRAFT_424029 [Copromyces sp. CBS 386.78]|nr:hypothetical protein QBC45DRAFT_424029 [Copromyces sp. CBS 386.78]
MEVTTMLTCTRSLHVIWGGLLALLLLLASPTIASPGAVTPNLPIAIRDMDTAPPCSLIEPRDYNTSPVFTIPPTIQQDLSSLLSPQSLILLPSSPSFSSYTHRWSSNPRTNSPTYGVIVIPASESDVSLTIRYANTHGIPFLATTGTHGTWHGLAQLQGGMAIWTRNLTKMEFAADGKSATLGGGLRGDDVVPALWARGKQTTTGSCRCVSLLGPALGGGHGWLQGQYGLGADQILSARVVLANGTAVRASKTENGDLFWALRGAGHNFGVVTEVEYRLYDAGVRPDWAYQSYTFTQDRLEDVYRVHDEVMGNQSQYVVYWSSWRLVPEVDAVNPILVSTVYYNGPPSEAASYFAPFAALNPLDTTPVLTTDYPGLAAAAQFRVTDWACQPKAGGATVYGMDVDSYDVPALRQSYNAFRDMMRTEPALSASMAYLEGYSLQAVQAVPYESTAFALRDRKLLYGFLTTYEEQGNKTLDAAAQKWGEKIRDAAYGNVSQKSAYVNYAKGSESQQAMYGYESWRQERLKQLKKKYDPKGRFSFYAPIKA